VTIGDAGVLAQWEEGRTLEAIASEFGKTPTSIAHKLVRLGIVEDRGAANRENEKRGGESAANLEHDTVYTIYVVRNPFTRTPVYVGFTQNFHKRRKNHARRFSKTFCGDAPIIEELETVASYALARDAEKKHIANMSDKGISLLNVLDRELCRDA
jgi:predicted GIY-YIG superfamily endonuclease